ncbi:MAG: histidine phosphatase family protein [Crocinitomicaceae bacterium]|nr:histidine phosphatase family protein [Crocinitomicaceae bacterium]
MKLHILRHADTESIISSGHDFDRILIPEGEKRAVKMGIYLNDQLSRKIAVYCSSSNRTRQTAALVQSKFEFRNIQFKKELYHASSTQLMNFINELEDDGPVLIIGHNEGISDLVSYLTGENMYLNPCQYVSIEFNATNWKEVSGHTGRLVANYRPELV